MTFTNADISIHISEGVLNVFNTFKQTGRKKEKGGILLGYRLNNAIFITKASLPNDYDKSNRFSFVRHKKPAQLIVDYEFVNSEGRIIYLGEWHTHPQDYPLPSPTDIKMIETQFKKNKINEDFLIMAIVGIKGLFVAKFDGINHQTFKSKVTD